MRETRRRDVLEEEFSPHVIDRLDEFYALSATTNPLNYPLNNRSVAADDNHYKA